MDLSSVLDVLAKEIGKGGGGSTEEPTVCFALLPIGLGLLWIGIRAILKAAWRQDGRSEPHGSERKVQTA